MYLSNYFIQKLLVSKIEPLWNKHLRMGKNLKRNAQKCPNSGSNRWMVKIENEKTISQHKLFVDINNSFKLENRGIKRRNQQKM